MTATTTSTRRGESTRNSARTNSRNSEALDNLLDAQGGIKSVSFHYQYCRNYHCSAITAVMVPTTPDCHDDAPLKQAQYVAEALNVPLLVVVHEPKDERNVNPVTLEVTYPGEHQPEVRPGQSWRDMSEFLRGLQKSHEARSDNPQCGPVRYEDTWLSRGRARGMGSLDLSMSNAIREVPGVGHLDVDAAICCEECHTIEALVEASSDGMEGTRWSDRNKATRMTRRLSHVIGCYTLLIQHYPNDNNHENPVTVTGWFANGAEFCSGRTMNWAELSTSLDSIHSKHANKSCPFSTPPAEDSEVC